MSAMGTITWWGASGVELSFGGRRLLIDPYWLPESVSAQYVCVTREGFDHCHEPTLERLSADPAFERMLAPRTATMRSKLDQPVPADARDLEYVDPERLTIMHPKYTKRPAGPAPDIVEIALDGFHVEAVDSSEYEPVNVLGNDLWGKRLLPEGERWPAATGAFAGPGTLPALGYVIAEATTGLTVYHPGDLQEAFDSQRELRGRIDYLFLPTATLEGAELSVVDNVRPRFVIPIHYRVDTPDFPIPLEVESSALTTTDLFRGLPRPWAPNDVYRRELHALMETGWYPTPERPLERMAEIEGDLAELGAQLLVLEAGKPYDVPCGERKDG
jgi:L-ascorbate metabolism protein UlaG (beta-lactamase superfamily)